MGWSRISRATHFPLLARIARAAGQWWNEHGRTQAARLTYDKVRRTFDERLFWTDEGKLRFDPDCFRSVTIIGEEKMVDALGLEPRTR